MIRLPAAGIASSVILVSGCSSDEREDSPQIPSEAAQLFLDVQQRTGLSDDELASAVQRWAKVDRAFKEAIDQGLTTEEEISAMYRKMPQSMQQVEGLGDRMLEQDAMAAAVALSVLRRHHEGNADEALPMLRDVVARYCRGLPDPPSELEAGFLAKVERLAQSDPELKGLLEDE